MEPEFPIVYMSAAAAADWTSKGVPTSIMLAKPLAPAQLLTAVSNLLTVGTPTTQVYKCCFVRDPTFRGRVKRQP
jgi:hypothetical protein